MRDVIRGKEKEKKCDERCDERKSEEKKEKKKGGKEKNPRFIPTFSRTKRCLVLELSIFSMHLSMGLLTVTDTRFALEVVFS